MIHLDFLVLRGGGWGSDPDPDSEELTPIGFGVDFSPSCKPDGSESPFPFFFRNSTVSLQKYSNLTTEISRYSKI
jgi:hypothetical protein